MCAWTSENIAKIVEGTLQGDPDVVGQGCLLDSRRALGGEIFFALPGERADGHQFIRAAWDQGAGLAVAEKKRWAEMGQLTIPPGKAVVLVDSVLRALQKLASVYRGELGARVIGITGSNGKTTTKDMVASVLARRYRVHKNKENHNNELGLPLTILNAPVDTEVLVLEMGMRGLGEIKELCAIGHPETGVITNIGTTHIELLGTQENIAKAKWELIEALPLQGTAILNADDQWSADKGQAEQRTKLFYGIKGAYAEPDISAQKIQPDGALGTSFEVCWGGERQPVFLPLPGEHNVLDALAAISVGIVHGVSLREACQGLLSLELSRMRLEMQPGLYQSILISDVYNANPISMQASLQVLRERGGDSTLAILGEMYELGAETIPGHQLVGKTAAELEITELVTVGKLAEEIAAGAKAAGMPAERLHVCATKEAAIQKARECLACMPPETWVLLKASRGMKLEEITTQLQVAQEKGKELND